MTPSTITLNSYNNRPFDLKAIRVTRDNFASVALWCGGVIKNRDGSDITIGEDYNPSACFIEVPVKNTNFPNRTRALLGNWVIVSDEKGFKVYTDKAFNLAFVPSDQPPVTVDVSIKVESNDSPNTKGPIDDINIQHNNFPESDGSGVEAPTSGTGLVNLHIEHNNIRSSEQTGPGSIMMDANSAY